MHPAETLELVLAMLGAVLVLHWLAERLRWPPSAALLIGGGALAFIPGVPLITLDPELVLVLFLPPLLVDGAWHTELVRFRRHLAGILSLAVGAVIFSTLVVAAVAHWLMPTLPWAACAALGAIVSPPDAVSARAVLQRVQLPRRLQALLEGESLLNDATGLVIFRFAVAATMGAGFQAGEVLGRFVLLVLGGVAIGLAVGALWVVIGRRLRNELLLIVMTVLVGWVAYLSGEALGVSGVVAAVTAGLVLGWQQHVIFSAAVRLRGTSFWQVLVFLLEASVFILIGISLRDILTRAGGLEAVAGELALPLLAIVLTLTLARFAWIFASDAVVALLRRMGIGREPPIGPACATVMGWAGMRGVVTLAAALTLPADFPQRDFMLLAAFGVILVTVLVQGSTLGLLIRWTGLRRTAEDEPPMDMTAAERAMMQAQLFAVERLARDEAGNLVHPQLLRRYTARATAGESFTGSDEERTAAIASHFDVIIGAVAAGREELVRLHRTHQIDNETLRSLELDLDLEELGAESAKA
ncbi:Na+/H+ antiporter [Sphingomonas sp. KR1UV-12]|uniref:Na+/H+ antiporter n=1 Tax=Sphingomonas aurea TaxID=3063994 RepID=A0ABT9EH69_9SPHN|nr:Na+/H+ antiporter [Sphingomonas sp. KR1UV-12]MDP1026254.1 Na+/H+ antiporter [Sphingomonas sp. KR1UV-12]